MKIIVGLGNPKKKYEKTRHNVGFLVLDKLAHKNGLNWRQNKKAISLITEYEGDFLVKPQTFMNNSGISVESLLSYHQLLSKKWKLFTKENTDLTNNLIVLHDDIDLALGKYKISFSSGSAGHKGVQSIINHIKTKQFTRMRIGIAGKEKNNNIATPNFVLKKFSKKELQIIDNTASQIIEKL